MIGTLVGTYLHYVSYRYSRFRYWSDCWIHVFRKTVLSLTCINTQEVYISSLILIISVEVGVSNIRLQIVTNYCIVFCVYLLQCTHMLYYNIHTRARDHAHMAINQHLSGYLYINFFFLRIPASNVLSIIHNI